MFSTTRARNLHRDSTRASDRELLRLALSGSTPNSARLWQLHPELFEHGGPPVELPMGWEQRVDGKSGRVFYINHNERTTSWKDPRKEQAADREADVNADEEEGEPEAMFEEEDAEDAEDAEDSVMNATLGLDIGRGDVAVERLTHDHGPASALATTAVSTAAGAGSASAPVGAVPARVLPIVGSVPSPSGRRSELQLLSSGLLLPSAERLSRRALLQHESAREALLARLPEAADDGGLRRGYGLLQQRRLRLLQLVHLALVRERERAA
jgi:hypothetical protein